MDATTEGYGKRKRKKSFLQKAKKYGKKGKFGRGSHVTEDIYQYFVRVLEMSRQEFDTEEDKETFINNIFSETVGVEIYLSCNQLVSRAIENLLPCASQEVIQRFTEAFGKDLRPIFGDPFASHVLQKLLLIVAKQTKESLIKDVESGDKALKMSQEDWVLRVGRFGLNNIEDFAWDMYANHVLRTILLCLSGGEESEGVKTGKGGVLTLKDMEMLKCEENVPELYIEQLREYQQSLASWPQIAELAFERLTSGLLQSLLYALKRAGEIELCNQFAEILINQCFKKYASEGESLFECDYALHLMDSVLATASPDVYGNLFQSCLKGRLQKLANHTQASFTIQRVFDFCPEKTLLEESLDEMVETEGGINDIFTKGFFGVLSSMAKSCKRLGHKQGVFMLNFMKILGCSQPADRQLLLVPLAIRMSNYETLFDEEGKQKINESDKLNVNLHGSLILQSMLHFNKPIKIVNSLLEMSPPELQELFCDPKGSRIMDAYMESSYVGGKSRERMIKKLAGTYVAMATSKHGSRSFEAAWAAADMKQRQSIASELSAREGQVTGNRFGLIISSKIALPLYRRSLDDWLQFQSGHQKKRELFADIIGTAASSEMANKPIEEEDNEIL